MLKLCTLYYAHLYSDSDLSLVCINVVSLSEFFKIFGLSVFSTYTMNMAVKKLFRLLENSQISGAKHKSSQVVEGKG